MVGLRITYAGLNHPSNLSFRKLDLIANYALKLTRLLSKLILICKLPLMKMNPLLSLLPYGLVNNLLIW
jgi:hypothetical protein